MPVVAKNAMTTEITTNNEVSIAMRRAPVAPQEYTILARKPAKKDQGEVDRENTGKEEGSDSESLHKFHDAEDGLVARVRGSDGGLLAVKVCGGSPLLKGPSDIGAVVKKSVRGRGRR